LVTISHKTDSKHKPQQPSSLSITTTQHHQNNHSF